jgi:aminopeptidase-like protein
MELQFVNSAGMTERQLSMVEDLFGTALTPELRTFLKVHAGSKPTINGDICCIDIKHSDGWKQSSCIERIVSFESLLVKLENCDYLNEFVVHFGLTYDYVEAKYLFPLAELPNGSLLTAVNGRHTGKVYTADNGDFGILFHSESLAAFWASVYKR